MAESVQAGLSDYVRANFPNATVLKKLLNYTTATVMLGIYLSMEILFVG